MNAHRPSFTGHRPSSLGHRLSAIGYSLRRALGLLYLVLICTPPVLFLEWLWRMMHRRQVAAALRQPPPHRPSPPSPL